MKMSTKRTICIPWQPYYGVPGNSIGWEHSQHTGTVFAIWSQMQKELVLLNSIIHSLCRIDKLLVCHNREIKKELKLTLLSLKLKWSVTNDVQTFCSGPRFLIVWHLFSIAWCETSSLGLLHQEAFWFLQMNTRKQKGNPTKGNAIVDLKICHVNQN